MANRIKIIIAKVGLDGHDRGAKLLCRYLRDAGMDVIYTGIRQTPEAVALIAMQENVDIIGISILSGAHNYLIPQTIEELIKKGLDIPVVAGGIIPNEDLNYLKSKGVRSIFQAGAEFSAIVKEIYEICE